MRLRALPVCGKGLSYLISNYWQYDLFLPSGARRSSDRPSHARPRSVARKSRRWTAQGAAAGVGLLVTFCGPRELLNTAAWSGNLAAVRTLLSVGFNVAWANGRRTTALHSAAWQRHVDIVLALLEHHAPLDPNK